ncbi:nuclear transport factor 2 domain protein, partial [Teladorsagia circumcincta]
SCAIRRMKMNVVDDLVIRSEPAYTEADPTPDAIGLEFVRQYYTILSKSPGCVHKFYSHESVFVHNDVTVIGQQKIKNCIEQLVEANNRFKIHSVKGSFTSHKGIVLQVCGEVATRRFFQTFILGQQSAKKFYVQNDIFQFLDVAFHSESQGSPAPAAPNETAVTEAQSVDIDLVQNGHNHSHSSIALSCEETPILTSVVSHAKASPAKNPPALTTEECIF